MRRVVRLAAGERQSSRSTSLLGVSNMDKRAGLRAGTLWILALAGAIASGCGDESGDPVITTASLGEAEQGQPYSAEILAQGAGRLEWSVAPESSVPPGLTLQSAGDKSAVLAGTPIAPGVFRFGITLVDSRGRRASRELSLSVRSSLSLDGISLPVAVEGRDYEAPLAPSGGAGSGLEWTLVSGALPPGLALEDTAERVAVIRGRPGPGTFRFAVSVADGAGGRAERQLELQVRSSLAVAASEPTTGRTGRAYAWALSVQGGLGEGVGWRVLEDALPPGLSFGPVRGRGIEIRGVPVSAGTYPVTIVVEDDNRGSAEAPFTIEVFRSLQMATQSLPTANRGGAYSVSLEATGGGSVNYVWSLASGDLPPGLELTDDGATATISGTATTLGRYTFTASVATPVDEPVTREFELFVSSAPPRIATESLPAAEWGDAYAATVEGVSRVGGPVEWSVEGLPPGLVMEQSSTATVGLSGVPLVAGDFNVNVRMSDAGGNDLARLTVRVGATRLAVEKVALPLARVGDGYQHVLKAINAVGATTWTVTDGALPAGITLASNGVLTGTPTVEGTFRFDLGVEDAAASSARGRFAMHVRPQRTWIIVSHATDGSDCGADNVLVLDVSNGIAGRRHDVATDLGGPCSTSSVDNLSVSPDSRWASFDFGSSSSSVSLYLVNLRGDSPSVRVVASNLPRVHAALRWSPDGQSALYASYASAPALNHWLLDLSADAPQPIEAGLFTARAVAWSPDGRRFALFSSDHDTLLVTSREGATWRTRTFSIGASFETGQLHWTPDSRRVVYGRSGALEGMYSIDVEATPTAAVKLTTPGTFLDHSFSDNPLSPDGSRLLLRLMPPALVMDLSTDASVTTPMAGPVPSRIWGGWSPDSRHRLIREVRRRRLRERGRLPPRPPGGRLRSDPDRNRRARCDHRMYWTPGATSCWSIRGCRASTWRPWVLP